MPTTLAQFIQGTNDENRSELEFVSSVWRKRIAEQFGVGPDSINIEVANDDSNDFYFTVKGRRYSFDSGHDDLTQYAFPLNSDGEQLRDGTQFVIKFTPEEAAEVDRLRDAI
jgi:hypothetical protein